MNTKQKGTLAVAQCIAKLSTLGYEISLPLGDRKPYDLIFDDGNKLNKVQVKYSGKGSNGKYSAYLRITGGNQSFNYAKKYKDDDFDYLYIYTADNRHYLMRWKEIRPRNKISLDDKKYQKYLIKY
ncbi:MAG: group I intron-associated PD-(D/E)XK endonuclease [Patescibacteria group bacterium]